MMYIAWILWNIAIDWHIIIKMGNVCYREFDEENKGLDESMMSDSEKLSSNM
jgi:hypothetical protein